MVVTSEEYKLATLKAVYDYVNAVVLGDIKRKGSKATFAEIEALTDMQINDMWECQENHHSYLYLMNYLSIILIESHFYFYLQYLNQ